MDVAFSGVVYVAHRHIHLEVDGNADFGDTVYPPVVSSLSDYGFTVPKNRIFAAYPEGLRLRTGLESHEPTLRVETFSARPGPPSTPPDRSQEERANFLRPAFEMEEYSPAGQHWRLPWVGPSVVWVGVYGLNDGSVDPEVDPTTEDWLVRVWPDPDVPTYASGGSLE